MSSFLNSPSLAYQNISIITRLRGPSNQNNNIIKSKQSKSPLQKKTSNQRINSKSPLKKKIRRIKLRNKIYNVYL